MIHLSQTVFFAIVLISLQSCKDDLTPINDLSLFTSHAVIEPDFEFDGNLCFFSSPEIDSAGTIIVLTRVEGDVAFDNRYNQFLNQYKEIIDIRIPDLNLGCYDLKSITSAFPVNYGAPATYSRTNFDETGEQYDLSLAEEDYSELCITHISSDHRVIEGTYELVLIFDPIITSGRKPFAPWLPDTLRFRDGIFTARVGVD